MKTFTFFFVFLYSILSLAQEKPFILKVAKTQNGLLIPATSDYKLTVKDNTGTIIIDNKLKSELILNETNNKLNHLDNNSYTTINSAANGTIFTLEFTNVNATQPLKISGRKSGTNYFTDFDTSVMEISQWGTVLWDPDLSYFMYNAKNLIISAIDIPNFSNVRNFNYAFYNASLIETIPNINNWDVSMVSDMQYMFGGARKFNADLNNWDVSVVRDMNNMFWQANVFNGDISSWTTSNVSNMSYMFNGASVFNQDIGNWDTKNVSQISYMFHNATNFNQDISNWNTAKVEGIGGTFLNATNFNQDLSRWNMNSVVIVRDFLTNSGLDCVNFSKLLNNWATNYIDKNWDFGTTPINLTYNQTASIAYSLLTTNSSTHVKWSLPGVKYDQNCGIKPFTLKVMKSNDGLLIPSTGNYLLTIKDDTGHIIDGLNKVSNLALSTYINNTTESNSNPNIPPILYNHFIGDPTQHPEFTTSLPGTIYFIEFWNRGNSGLKIQTAKPTSSQNRSFPNEPYKYSNSIQEIMQWGEVTWSSDMSHFMSGAYNVILTASDFPDFSNVTDMSYMFSYAEKFNGNIGNWDTSKVIDMKHMFEGARVFNQPIGNWNTSNVENMSYMFSTGSTTYTNHPVFNQNISTKVVTLNGNTYTAWDTSKVKTMHSMFNYAIKFDQPIGNWNTSIVEDMSGMFFGAELFNNYIGDWNTAEVTNMSSMFTYAKIFNQDISTKTATLNDNTYTAWNTGKVTDMNRMFEGSEKFDKYIGNWNTSKVEDMSRMFYNTISFNQDISTKIITQNNTTYTAWDTYNVKNMSSMFFQALVFNQPIVNWNTSAVINMSGMFHNASIFNKNISTKEISLNNLVYNAWNTSIVTDMHNMFNGTNNFNQNIDNWNVENVKDMNRMFQNAIAFQSNLSNWNVSRVKDMTRMFDGAINFTSNLGRWNITGIIEYFPPSGLSGITGLYYMLNNSGLTCTDFSNTLIGWANNTDILNKSLNLNNVGSYNLSGILEPRGYSTLGKSAFNTLINNNWTILSTFEDTNCATTVCTKSPTMDMIERTVTPSMIISLLNDNSETNKRNLNYNDSYNSFFTLKKGFVLPRSTNESQFVTGTLPEGLIYYDTTESCIKMYSRIDGELKWKCISATCND